MKLQEKIKKARDFIEFLKENEDFSRAEIAEDLLAFALFYVSLGRIHKAHYRLNKILKEV